VLQWRDDDDSERLTLYTDVYSFGGCMIEVLTGKIPWAEEKNKYQIYQKVITERKQPPMDPVKVILKS